MQALVPDLRAQSVDTSAAIWESQLRCNFKTKQRIRRDHFRWRHFWSAARHTHLSTFKLSATPNLTRIAAPTAVQGKAGAASTRAELNLGCLNGCNIDKQIDWRYKDNIHNLMANT
jgi:hypothetical protein